MWKQNKPPVWEETSKEERKSANYFLIVGFIVLR